jgi:hypothetical protein
MWITCGLMWITYQKLWITFIEFLQNVDMWISAKSYPQVIHMDQARWHIRLSELSTYPHTPTTTTRFKFKS